MYAIVDIAGQQFKIQKDQQIFVHRLSAKEGSKVSFEKVLLLDKSGKVNIGTPFLKGAKVTAKIIEHLKDDKVIIFKKKRRKGYRVKNGHRQYLTKLEILGIDDNLSSEKKSTVKKSATAEKSSKKSATTEKPAKKSATAEKSSKKSATTEKSSKKSATAEKSSKKSADSK